MIERHLRVRRTARFHQLGDPATARCIWVVVHGYGQLARYFLNPFTDLAPGRVIIAPEGLNRFYTDPSHQRVGATWMTREDRENEIVDQVEYLDDLLALVRSETGDKPLRVLGFSQGVATVARWLVLGRARADRVVFWGGSLPPEPTAEQYRRALERTRVDLVHGSKDELVPHAVLRANEERLHAAGIEANGHLFPGGHSLDKVILARCMDEDSL